LLRRTRLDMVFKSYETDDDAVAAFGETSQAANTPKPNEPT
jgi:hypothetical protein